MSRPTTAPDPSGSFAFADGAARAWQWVPVRAGSEAALAAASRACFSKSTCVAHAARCRHSHSPKLPSRPDSCRNAIRDLARTIVARPPVVAIANDDNPAIAALNVVLGAVGARGGIVRRSKTAKARTCPPRPSSRLRGRC